MAGSFTDSMNNKILDHILGHTIYNPPEFFEIGLATNKANKSGIIEEVDQNKYQPAVIHNSADFWSKSVLGTKSNNKLIKLVVVDKIFAQSFFIRDKVSGECIAMADLRNPGYFTTDVALHINTICFSHT